MMDPYGDSASGSLIQWVTYPVGHLSSGSLIQWVT